ncbi:MAG: hypothetical protein LQ337_005246 [Flavoplaca oasis]|nr:MAG: hypothetical protein LQ337_005246 [Flavoplaca oasis]
MKVCDEDYNAAQRDSHDELTDPPISSAVTSSLGHLLVISVAEVGSSDRPIAIDDSEDEENNVGHLELTSSENIEATTTRVGDKDRRTDPDPVVPVVQPSAAQDPIQPPVSCDFKTSNRTPRARNSLGMSRKQKKNKRRLRDKKRRQEEETAAQHEIEAGSSKEARPLNREFIAGSEDIPNSMDNLAPAITSSELVVAPPAPRVNTTLGIERKDKAYGRVITRLCFAHIDANIYIKEIAKDTEDHSTAEKLTKLCDQMTTAKNMALRNLRGHSDTLERVMDSLRGKTG